MVNNKDNKSLEELQVELEQAKKAYELVQQFYEKKEKEEAEKREAKLAVEKEVRYKEIAEMIDKLETLIKNWNTDYGSFVFHGKSSISPYLWHYFF